MKSKTLLIAMLVCMTASAQTDYRKGEVIVKFKNGAEVVTTSSNEACARGEKPSVNSKVVKEALLQLGVTEVSQLMPLTGNTQNHANARGSNQLKSPMTDLSQLCLLIFDETKGSVEDVIKALKQLDEVEFAEPNRIVYLAATDVSTYMAEPRFGEQWGLKAIRMPELWAQPIINSKRPVIAILDTGVDTEHPDLKANLLPGYNAIDENTDVTDENGHGTHCAGIAAGVGNNDVGITGANPNAQILPVKVIGSDGVGYMGDIYRGLDYAIAHGADIISMSLGCLGNVVDEYEYEIFKAASNSAIIVAAAGNNSICMQSNHVGVHSTSEEPSQPFFPAAYDCVIGVQSTDQMGRRSSFSNYDCDGPLYSDFEKKLNYEVKAPGSAILSTYKNHTYRTLDGTSMACPLVAGAISRLLQCKNFASREQLVKTLIETSGDCIDMMAAYQYTVDKLNAETFTADCNGVTITFHKTSSSTVEVGNGSTAAISTTVKELIIPETAHGYLVTGVAANAFKGCTQLTWVSLPYSITAIGAAAFNGCNSLTTLQMMSIPWSVVPTCASNAFSNAHYSNCKLEVLEQHVASCRNDGVWGHFTSIQKPEYALGDIFKETIEGVNQHFRVTSLVPRTVEICGYERKVANDDVELSKADSVSIRIPEEVRGFVVNKIGNMAFYWCREMAYLDIPETITEIGGGAFYCCYGLRSLHIPASVKYIENDITLRGIVSCPTVRISDTNVIAGYVMSDVGTSGDDNIQTLSFGTFWNMALLESVSVAEGNPNYTGQTGTIVENSSKILLVGCKGAIIPQGTKYIGPNAFSHQNINKIVIPEGVIKIDDSAFYHAHLTEISLPESLEEIAHWGLANNFDLKEIKLPSKLETLGVDAMSSCYSWRTIEIPASMKDIGQWAFAGNNNLRYVIVNNREPIQIPHEQTTDVFYYYLDEYSRSFYPFDQFYEYAVLYVPQGCKAAYQTAEGWKQFKNIVEISDVKLGDVDGNGVLNDQDRQVMEGYLTRYYGIKNPIDLYFTVVPNYLDDFLQGNALPDVRDVAADLNSDGEIDFHDYVILVNLLNGKEYNPDAALPEVTLTIDPTTIPDLWFSNDVVVRLQGNSDITAMILNITMPEELDFYDQGNWLRADCIQLPERYAETHSVVASQFGGFDRGRLFFVFPKANDVFSPSEDGNDELFRIHVYANSSFDDAIGIKTPEISMNAQMVATSGKSVETTASGVVLPQHLTFAPGQQWQTYIGRSSKTFVGGIGAKAYAVTGMTPEAVTVQEIPGGIPDGQAVLVGLDEIPTEETTIMLKSAEVPYYSGSNMLYGSNDGPATGFNPYDVYVLYNDEFVLNSETTVPAGKAYIWASNASASVLDITVGGSIPVSILDTGNGTVSYKTEGNKVVLTVTPDQGYYTRLEHIRVEKTVDGSVAAQARGNSPRISSPLEVTPGADVDTRGKGTYTFTVPEGYGACVSVTFCEASSLGDANGDGDINGMDVDAVAHYIITGDTENFIFSNANVNYDNKVNIVDLVIIIKMVGPAQQ